MTEKTCGIPSQTLGPCDLEWGHEGDLHSSAGDGFYAQEHLPEHHQRQADKWKVEPEKAPTGPTVFGMPLASYGNPAEVYLRTGPGFTLQVALVFADPAHLLWAASAKVAGIDIVAPGEPESSPHMAAKALESGLRALAIRLFPLLDEETRGEVENEGKPAAKSAAVCRGCRLKQPTVDGTGFCITCRFMRESVLGNCLGCGAPLLPEQRTLADGCPCNSPRGVNHGVVHTTVCTCLECDTENTGASRWDKEEKLTTTETP